MYKILITDEFGNIVEKHIVGETLQEIIMFLKGYYISFKKLQNLMAFYEVTRLKPTDGIVGNVITRHAHIFRNRVDIATFYGGIISFENSITVTDKQMLLAMVEELE